MTESTPAGLVPLIGFYAEHALARALAAGLTEQEIGQDAWEIVQGQHPDGVPAHLALALAPREDGYDLARLRDVGCDEVTAYNVARFLGELTMTPCELVAICDRNEDFTPKVAGVEAAEERHTPAMARTPALIVLPAGTAICQSRLTGDTWFTRIGGSTRITRIDSSPRGEYLVAHATAHTAMAAHADSLVAALVTADKGDRVEIERCLAEIERCLASA